MQFWGSKRKSEEKALLICSPELSLSIVSEVKWLYVCVFFFCSWAVGNVGSSWWWTGNTRPALPVRTACQRPNATACPPPSTATLTSTAASTWPRTAPSSAPDVPTPQVRHTHTPARTTTSSSLPPSSAPGWPSTLKNSTKWPPRWRKESPWTAPEQTLGATRCAPSKAREWPHPWRPLPRSQTLTTTKRWTSSTLDSPAFLWGRPAPATQAPRAWRPNPTCSRRRRAARPQSLRARRRGASWKKARESRRSTAVTTRTTTDPLWGGRWSARATERSRTRRNCGWARGTAFTYPWPNSDWSRRHCARSLIAKIIKSVHKSFLLFSCGTNWDAPIQVKEI